MSKVNIGGGAKGISRPSLNLALEGRGRPLCPPLPPPINQMNLLAVGDLQIAMYERHCPASSLATTSNKPSVDCVGD